MGLMRQRLMGILLMGICGILMSACSVKEMTPEGVVNGDLKTYTLKSPNKYSGMGQYFHEVQTITQISESPYVYELSGEVKSDAIDRSKGNHSFLVKGYVDESSWVETYDDSLLGESELRQVVLLKAPLEMGATWTFKTTDKHGEKYKIQAEITSKTENEIEVVYTDDSIFFEKRLFKKDNGTVKFVKEFKIASTKAVTGYALIKDENIQKNPFDRLKPIDIAPEILTLIRDFNEAMVKGDLDLQKTYTLSETPAYEKVSLEKEAVEAWSLEGLKVYQKEETESSISVTVLEKFRQKDSVYYNAVQYELVFQEGKYYIFDFEPVEINLE